jgi:hypothetical protein
MAQFLFNTMMTLGLIIIAYQLSERLGHFLIGAFALYLAIIGVQNSSRWMADHFGDRANIEMAYAPHPGGYFFKIVNRSNKTIRGAHVECVNDRTEEIPDIIPSDTTHIIFMTGTGDMAGQGRDCRIDYQLVKSYGSDVRATKAIID